MIPKENAMKIQVLGSGCAKCEKLGGNVKKAVQKLGIDAEIEKVTDLNAIIKAGVMSTPALVIDGTVKASGRILSPDQVAEFITQSKG